MQAGPEPPSFIFQIVVTLLVLGAIYGLMTIVDKSINAYSSVNQNEAVLIPDTTQDTSIIPQSLQSDAPLLYPSSNQPSGHEFSYSCFLKIDPATFSTSSATTCNTENTSNSGVSPVVLKHIFSKGTAKSFPLMAPGVFVQANTNTLVVYMNTANSWNNTAKVDNIPIDKFFHLAIILTGSYMDIYINGNVANRVKFNAVPKINFGPVFILNPRKFPDSPSVPKSISDVFVVDGAAKAMISRLQYFAYAMNSSQIDSLYRQGPSSKISGSGVLQTPPYLADTWWVGQAPGSS